MKNYPPVPMIWAKKVGSLTPSEITYGIRNEILENGRSDQRAEASELSSVLDGAELADCRDVLFRILLVHLYKNWFSADRPLRALEFLVLDFEDCPTAATGDGRLLSGVAGISEGNQAVELDPEYFEQKVRTFRFLTEFVVEIVREGMRRNNR